MKTQVKRGRFGGKVQYYIEGVDGTLAQLGDHLPSAEKLKKNIANAKRAHVALVRRHNRGKP
jgi:hypothetical protein